MRTRVVYPELVEGLDYMASRTRERAGTNGSINTTLMPYYFYLARCSDGSLYAGTGIDLRARESKHNEGKGAKYTRSRCPVKIAYHEEFSTLVEARRREVEVKTWSRVKKENLVERKYLTKG